MSDVVGISIIGIVVCLGLLGITRLSKPYDVSNDEFEKRASEGPGLLGAGLISIQKALDPGVERAAVVQEDLKQGRYDGEQGSGEPPETGANEMSNKSIEE